MILNRETEQQVEVIVYGIVSLAGRVDALQRIREGHESQISRMRSALDEMCRLNAQQNNIDNYAHSVGQWGLGRIEEHPNPKDWGIE